LRASSGDANGLLRLRFQPLIANQSKSRSQQLILNPPLHLPSGNPLAPDTAVYSALERISMATPAQLFANQENARHSTGPVTPEGKARASQNAATLGIFSTSAFIRTDEREAYNEFRAAWNARLVPDGPLEETLVGELVQAAWRLRRCTLLETASYPAATPGELDRIEELDRIQASIDRARTTAQRALQRTLHELRRMQTERQMRDAAPCGQLANAGFGAASIRDVETFIHQIVHRYPEDSFRNSPASLRWENSKRSHSAAADPRADSAKRSQPDPAPIPRGASCPCGSGEKYKRCCGKGGPPVLSYAS